MTVSGVCDEVAAAWGVVGIGEGGMTSGENTESESDSVPDTATELSVGFWCQPSQRQHNLEYRRPATGPLGEHMQKEGALRGTVPLHSA